MPKPTWRSEVANTGVIGRPSGPRPSAMLAQAGVRPSRKRGQNFLVQAAVAERIVAMAALEPDDEVIEIGPGLGILSERMAARPLGRLSLIEVDPRLAAQLRTRFAGYRNVRIIETDVLVLDLTAVIARPPVKVVGNLPFSIAAAILRRLAEYRHLVARMVLMFQREVAERIRARAGEHGYGALSAFTALDWLIDAHLRVDAGNFHPRPAVDAEVLGLLPRPHPLCEPARRPAVLATIRAAFSSPRKALRNSLSTGLKLDTATIEAALKDAALDPRARAATLAIDDFVALAASLGRMREAVAGTVADA